MQLKTTVSIYFLVRKGLSIDDVGEGVEGHRTYVFREIRPGAGFVITGDFVKKEKSRGGYRRTIQFYSKSDFSSEGTSSED